MTLWKQGKQEGLYYQHYNNIYPH